MCRPTRPAFANANDSGNNTNSQNRDDAPPIPSPPAAASGLRRSRPSASSLVVLASPPPVLPNDLTSTAVILPHNSTAVSFSIEVQFRTVPGRWQMSDEEMGDVWHIEEGAAPEQTFQDECRDTIQIVRQNRGNVNALDPTTHTIRGIEHLLTLEALTKLNQEKTASIRSVLAAVGSTISVPFSDELCRISMEVTREAVERARQRGLQDEADAQSILHQPPRLNHHHDQHRPSGANTSTTCTASALAAAVAVAATTATDLTMPSSLPPSERSPLQAAALPAAVQVPQESAATISSSDIVCSVSSGSDCSESSNKSLVSIEAGLGAGMQLPSIPSITLRHNDGESSSNGSS